MALAIKPGYQNPLSMAARKPGGLANQNPQMQPGAKKPSTQDLQMERQSLQNQILLLKGTSDGGAVDPETQKLLEGQMEELSAQIKAAKTQELSGDPQQADYRASLKARFDSFEWSGEQVRMAASNALLRPGEEKGAPSYLLPHK